ncbi:MAG: hypothetical protein JNM56_13960 [Planctomycetia bacterium]|nr:hypothetical protein [Planctomycetia bacterium]
MTRAAVAAICLGCIGLTFLPSFAAEEKQPPAAEHERAVELVRQLGSQSFNAREEASKKLMQLGRPAKQALLDGAKSLDLEVRTRCEQLLVDVLAADLKARVDAFIADKDGKVEHDLPGWKRYRELVGKDAGSRELFAEMCRAHSRLLDEADADPKAMGQKYLQEAQAMYQQIYQPAVGQRRQLTLADVATMLFIATDPEVPVPDQARSFTVNLLYQPAFNNAVRNGPRTEQARKLLGAWIAQAQGQSAVQTLNLAIQFGLKEGLVLALKLIESKDFANGMAITAVGKLGNKEHVPVLEKLLDNKTVVMNVNLNNKQGTTEVRDVALAVLIHLTGQQIKDYGYEFYRFPNNDQIFHATAYLAFAEQAKRDAAQQKWHDWKAKQPKP